VAAHAIDRGALMAMSPVADMLVPFAAGLALGAIIASVIALVIGSRRARRAEAERHRLELERATLQASLRTQAEVESERAAALAHAEEHLEASFGQLADRTLQSHSDAFLKLAQEHLGQHRVRADAALGEREQAIVALVKPIGEALRQTTAQLAGIEKERHEVYGQLRSELQGVHLAHQALHGETQELVKALRRPEVRGQWGEITLRRLTELAGMVENVDFVEQTLVAGEDGAGRPDMIVHLPDRRSLVVDVKTPLDAYLEAVDARDEDSRRAALQRHARTIRAHVRELAARRYWEHLEESPEFVILFIPGDQFLSAALEQDQKLLEDALREQVMLATPSTFVALLKAVAYGWRQRRLDENAARVRELAQTLHKRLGVFTEHLAALGKELRGSVGAYNRAVGSLETQVLSTARRLSELGIEDSGRLAALDSIEATPREPERATDENGEAR
jgi:DNA recombination protein RmuC